MSNTARFNTIAGQRAHRDGAAARHANAIGDIMSKLIKAATARRPANRYLAAAATIGAAAILGSLSLLTLSSEANACACGCSVFDVGAQGLPQEQDHGGNVFFEYWSMDQNQNYIGTSKAPAYMNGDKNINTQWYNVGFNYSFNRDWGVMVRIPTTNRTLTTDTGSYGGIMSFNSKDIGDIEIMGMYTGFFNDMSTGIMFGIKLPTGTYNAPGLDRDTQIGSGSTDLLLGAFHRGLLTGDNAWQYFGQIMWRQPFLYQAAADPQGFFDGSPGVVQTYYPGMIIDAAAGIVYNNWYHVGFFDKITPVAQVIMSHRNNDEGTGADYYNSGFDRVMVSPGAQFTKVVDEANNRVVKVYFDIEVPVYYRSNAANNTVTPGLSSENEGQLVAPYLIKVVASYNF